MSKNIFCYIQKIIANPRRVIRSVKYRLAKNTTEEKELQAYASLLLGYNVDLKNPKTFNEKLNWMKLFNRNPLYHSLVDKYEVKKYVEERIGSEYVVPCYGVWKSFDEIDFSTLPNKFVIKSTHYGAPVIVKDKSKIDYEELREIFIEQSKNSGYKTNYEWVYKDLQPRILIEKYLDDHTSNNVLQDYKFWCFNGVPRIMYLTVKDTEVYENFYDMNFNKLDINHGYPRRKPEFSKPDTFEMMKELATQLGGGIPFVRIDFYSVEGQIYFGEYTFYDWAGTHPFENYRMDLELGRLIELPGK